MRRPSANAEPRRTRRASLLVLALALHGCTLPRWPVQGPMTSPFGVRWLSLLPELHSGVDINVAEGTPVQAMAPGVVQFAGEAGAYGRTIIVDHRGGWSTLYAHLSEIHVRAGDRIAGHEVIGLSGSTGNATGPHLHFETRAGSRPRDPVPLLGGRP